MTARIQFDDLVFDLDLSNPIDISIPLRFNGPQPNAYGVAEAISEPVRAGELIGDTRQGGSVNFEQYTFIPHCNGTHTECVGHITHARIAVRDCLKDVLIPGLLVSIEPENKDGDLVISRDSLANAIANHSNGRALIIRTLPNDDSKFTRRYNDHNIPPYFTTEAMEYVVESGFKHLLVDLPSIDRLFDEGELLNHRIFWNVEPGAFETNPETRADSTITELIYIPNEVPDGRYLLNLQIAPFASDAAPSRPILFKLQS